MVALKFVEVHKCFNGVIALEKVSCEANFGEIVAVVGPNGSGKTTLFNVATGHLRPDSGQILLNGIDITGRQPSRIVKMGISRLFQHLRLFESTPAIESILLGQIGLRYRSLKLLFRNSIFSERDVLKLRQTMEKIGLTADDVRKPVKDLNFGHKKMVALGRVLIAEPSVILLDEPFAGLGEDFTQRMMMIIKDEAKRGRAIMFSEHNMKLVDQIADRVIVLQEGKLTEKCISNSQGN